MRNIKALRVIDPVSAPLFLKEALRYYSQELTGHHPKVALPSQLQITFQKIALQYLEWEGAGIKREIKAIDAAQQGEFRKILRGGSDDSIIPWRKIEAKALKD